MCMSLTPAVIASLITWSTNVTTSDDNAASSFESLSLSFFSPRRLASEPETDFGFLRSTVFSKEGLGDG